MSAGKKIYENETTHKLQMKDAFLKLMFFLLSLNKVSGMRIIAIQMLMKCYVLFTVDKVFLFVKHQHTCGWQYQALPLQCRLVVLF